ncbi:MAG: cyclase family protein [Thermoanaerobaculia bacterium]
MKRAVDLSHEIADGTVTYPGLPAPRITEFLSRADSRFRYAAGTEFQIGRIEMVANTGTYLDTPFHRYAEGYDLAALPLERVADLPAVVVHDAMDGGRAIGPERLAGSLRRGCALLVHTGWDRHWGTAAYLGGSPFLTRAACEAAVAAGVALVGIDSVNLDDPDDGTRPAHSVLLAAGIPVVEHLTGLERLPAEGSRFFAVPPKVHGFGTFVVRAFAIVD